MLLFTILFLFILGLFLGSFLNVLIDRYPKEESSLWGRSHCDHCGHVLNPVDLIPVVSFLMLGGKCRYCRKKMSYYYPVTEITTGLVFLGVLGYLGGPGIVQNVYMLTSLIYYLIVSSILIIIFFTDLKYGIIPLNAVIFGVVVVTVYLLLYPLNSGAFLSHLYAGIGAFLCFLLIFVATRGRGMGFGDVTFVFLMGLLLGFPKILPGVYIAFITGAIAAVFLVVAKKKKMKGGTIPFGPFLVIGTIVSIFLGDKIISFLLPYLHLT